MISLCSQFSTVIIDGKLLQILIWLLQFVIDLLVSSIKMSYTSKASTNTSKTVSSPLSSTVWIGNIGNDLSEQEVLDFAASVGKVIKFDFMYHDGKEAKLPRGYAFATYCGKL